MNSRNGITEPRIHKRMASRLLTFLLSISLAAGPAVMPTTVWGAMPTAAAQLSAGSFVAQKDLPADQSAITYASLKPAAFKNKPSIVLNKNVPKFTAAQLNNRKEYEKYSALDKYGRAQTAIACLSKKTMPKAPRGSIGMVKPAGFKTTKYNFIDGKYLYNRCI